MIVSIHILYTCLMQNLFGENLRYHIMPEVGVYTRKHNPVLCDLT